MSTFVQVMVGDYAGDSTARVLATVQGTAPAFPSYSTVNVNDNAWHHMVVTLDNVAGAFAYLDGVEMLDMGMPDPFPDINQTITNQYFGARNTNILEVVSPACLADELAIYDRALTSGEVADHYAARVSGYAAAVIADAPLMYFRLNESSGTVAVDAMGNSSGMYVDMAGLANGSVPIDTGTSVALAENTSYIRFPAVDFRSLVNLTMEFWFKLSGLPSGSQGMMWLEGPSFADEWGEQVGVIPTS